MSSQLLPRPLNDLIERLGYLPGVGLRTAERYAYFLLKNQDKLNQNLAEAIANLKANVKECPITFALIGVDDEISDLYSNPGRDKTIVALVEEPLDVVSIEKTGKYHGTYHVLGGTISPVDGITPDKLHIHELLSRLQKDKVKELIIATNASVEGESTALYIQKQIMEQGIDIEITRLARGIPIGTDLEYADQITLGHALEGRKKL